LTETVERYYHTLYPKTLHFTTLITPRTFIPASKLVPWYFSLKALYTVQITACPCTLFWP